MALKVLASCFGCGACESACGRLAIRQTESFAVAYAVDPLLCDDCMDCVRVCSVDALVPDPEWAVCVGRGCPLSSTRYDGWECSRGESRCPECGSMMWSDPEGRWTCSACRHSGASGARCPKTERLRRLEQSAGLVAER